MRRRSGLAPGSSKRDEARDRLGQFWARSNGGDAAFAELSEGLVALKLSQSDRDFLRTNLPITATGTGTTHAKIARARQCLDLLEA